MHKVLDLFNYPEDGVWCDLQDQRLSEGAVLELNQQSNDATAEDMATLTVEFTGRRIDSRELSRTFHSEIEIDAIKVTLAIESHPEGVIEIEEGSHLFDWVLEDQIESMRGAIRTAPETEVVYA